MGADKATLELPNGVTFVEQVVSVARAVADDVVLLGTPAALPAALARMTVLPDERPDCGPLGGLAALLAYAAPRPALLLACDMPRLTPAVLERLLASADAAHSAVVFRQAPPRQGFHACCGLYLPQALPVVRAQLAAGDLRMQNLLARLNVRALTPDAQTLAALANVNSPEDLADLR